MRSAYVKEEEPYTLGSLSDLFACSREETVATVRRLREFGIVKGVRSASERKNVSDLLQGGQVIATLDPNHHYKFTYVGLVVVGDLALKCYPKYLTKDVGLGEKLGQVLRVLEKHARDKQDIPVFQEAEGVAAVNSLGVMLFLLRDYFEHGLYSQSHDTWESNGRGQIDWDRTINESFAILDRGRPVYMNLVTRRRADDEFNFFRRLHLSCLVQISAALNDADLLGLLGMSHLDLCSDPVDSLGGTDYLLYRIQGELTQQFETRKQAVLKALHAYLSRDTWLGEEGDFSAFGTNSFNVVWESVCSSVLGNQRKDPMASLSLPCPLSENYNPEMSLDSVIEKPLWTGIDRTGNAFGKLASKSLEPDFVSVIDSGGRYDLVILDAKYYTITLMKDKKLSGQPGIADITKQYLYEVAFKEFADAHGISSVKNGFLMPSDGAKIKGLGCVSLDMLSGLGLEDIQLYLMPASEMFDCYLKSETMSVSSLYGTLNGE